MKEELEASFAAFESPDDRRTVTSGMIAMATSELPPVINRIDLDRKPTDILANQRKLGICTACAVTTAAEHAFDDGEALSEYWLYLIGKVTVDRNLSEGSSALSMLKAGNNTGMPAKSIEELCPVRTDGSYAEFIQHFNSAYGGKIPSLVMASASKHRIPGYYSVAIDPVSIARELAKGKVVIDRFTVGENTYRDASGNVTWDGARLLPLRAPKVIEGGHLWCISENSGLSEDAIFYGPNSWSRAWGNDGYYNFILRTQRPYFTEAWAIGDIPKGILENLKKDDFKVDLKYGMTHPDVRRLQQFLNSNGFAVSPIGSGSKGRETEYFGLLTRYALARYQKAAGIVPASGYFGPITRSKINALR